MPHNAWDTVRKVPLEILAEEEIGQRLQEEIRKMFNLDYSGNSFEEASNYLETHRKHNEKRMALVFRYLTKIAKSIFSRITKWTRG